MAGSAAVGAVIVGMIEVATLAVGKFTGMVMDPNAVQQELDDPTALSSRQHKNVSSSSSGSTNPDFDTSAGVFPSLAQPQPY